MSGNIVYGSDDLKSRMSQRSPEDKNVYINFDAINELPDEYEVVITEITFDPKKLDEMFSPVGGGNHMPQPQLMYKIADACGIGGATDKDGNPVQIVTEPIIEDIDINPMLMKPLDAAATLRRNIVGRRVTKISERLTEDGTMRRSSPCTCDYNAWERCVIRWGENPHKFTTPASRKLDFDTEMKFAHSKAESKAFCKTIRELAYMPTGYKAADLAKGWLAFSKVRRSRMVLKLETAARLDSMRNGGHPQSIAAPQPRELAAPEATAQADELILTPDPEPLTEREQMHKDLSEWKDKGLIPKRITALSDIADELPKYVAKIIPFLEVTDCEKHADRWKKAQRVHKEIKATIPAGVLNTKPEAKKEEDIF